MTTDPLIYNFISHKEHKEKSQRHKELTTEPQRARRNTEIIPKSPIKYKSRDNITIVSAYGDWKSPLQWLLTLFYILMSPLAFLMHPIITLINSTKRTTGIANAKIIPIIGNISRLLLTYIMRAYARSIKNLF
jgi:hypothetical protein